MDYVSWRGDIGFEQDGFNDVDNLVFSFVAYANFINVRLTKEENEKGITLKEYYDRLMEDGGFPKTLSWIIKEKELQVIAESRRFGTVLVKNYVDIVKSNENDAIQFAAMDFCFGKDEHYLAFRGTDDSIAGWKEDMELTYKKVPAQDLSVDYLESNIKEGSLYYVGGHSKGANLAIYSSAKVSKEKRKCIKKVYDNDGPGICRDVMDPSFLKDIDPITVRIVPSYSVIGMFFAYPFSDTRIVLSKERGLMQHDIKSWLVFNKEIVRNEKLDPEAERINKALDTYISNTKMEDRPAVINELIDIFGDSGRKKTVTSVTGGGLKELNRILVQFTDRNLKTKKVIVSLPFTVVFAKTLLKLRHIRPVEFFLRNPSFALGGGFLFLGLIFILVPYNYIPYFIASSFLVVTIVEFFTFFYFFYLTHWNLKTNLTRLYVTLIFISLSIAYFVSGEVMSGFSSVIFGIIMMALSFGGINRAHDMFQKKNYFSFALGILEIAFLLVLGLYFILIASFKDETIPDIMGYVFLGLGGLRSLEGILEAYKRKRDER